MQQRISQFLSSLRRTFKSRYWKSVAKWLLIVIPMGYMFKSLFDNWSEFKALDITVDFPILVFATIALIVSFTLLPLSTQLVLAGVGYPLKYVYAYCGYFLSQLAKYLPGGVWVVPGRILTLRVYGVSSLASSLGTILELLFLVMAGSLLFLLFFSFIMPSGTIFLVSVVTIIVGFLVLTKGEEVIRRLPRKWINSIDLKLNSSALLKIFTVNIVFWLALGSAFFLLTRSIHQVPFSLLPILIGAFSAAWVAGFVVFLTPGGLGVREGVLAVLLSPFFPAPIPVVIALLSRLWWTLGELLSVLIASATNRLIMHQQSSR